MKIIKKITAILLIILIFCGNIIYKKSYAAISINTTEACNPYYVLKYYANWIADENSIRNDTLDVTTLSKKDVRAFKSTNSLGDGKAESKDAVILFQVLVKLIAGEEASNYNNFINYCNEILDVNVKYIKVQISTSGSNGVKEGTSSKSMFENLNIDTSQKNVLKFGGQNLNPSMRTVFNLGELNDSYATAILEDFADDADTSRYIGTFCEAILTQTNLFKIEVVDNNNKSWDFAYGHVGTDTAFNGYLISEADKPTTPTTTPTTPTTTPSTTTPTPAKDTEFKTKLDYSAKIDGKDVGGSTNKDNYYVPNYIDPNKDKEGSKKDADVTATITVTSANDTIAKINNEVPGESSAKPNTLGWYYTDSTKTKISKLYPFKDYKEKNGVADLTEYTITGSDNNTSKQNVGVKWKFRIIDVSYNPANPQPSDKSVTVTITTNLPIDEKKLPKDWQINPNNNCQITKTFLRNDGDISEAVTVVKKGGDESDSTNIKITWPAEEQFDTKLDYSANIDGKEVGGELKGGVYYPKYDESNPKKDADVIATITTTTDGATIEKINDKDIGESKDNPNEDGWYYTNANDKTAVSKVYPFDKYNNSKDNGIVEEVAISKKGSSEKTSTQKVSVKWPFRIIDHTTKDNGDGSITETITTNLPMDPDKVPEGWTMVSGTDNHQITRTKTKNDGNIDEIVDVYQNGTGDKASTDSKYTWPEDNKPREENKQQKIVLPQTGESYVIAIFILLAVGMAVISRKKSRRNK